MTNTDRLHARSVPPLAALLVAAMAQAVSAQDMYGPGGESEGQWSFVLGGGAIYSPTFEGAKDYETTGFPFFSISYGKRISLGLDGLSYDLYQRGPLTFSTTLGYDFGRDEGDDAHLAGLGDIDGGATLGFGMGYELGAVDLSADLERSFGDSDGLTAKFGAEVSRPVGRVLLGAGVSAIWADDNYMQSYFGVTSAQAARSGLAGYTAGAGFKSVDLELSATYMFAENWMLRGQIGVSELVGDAADSPIVQDSTQSMAGVFVAYRF